MTEEELVKLKVQLAEDMREKREVTRVERMMEEFANAGKEPMGTRTPGETCMYEQR